MVGSIVFNIPPTQKVEATLSHVTICHKESQPWQTLSVAIAAIPAHLAHGDSLGACPEPTSTPTPSPTNEPSPTPSEEPSPTPTGETSPTPTVEPSVSPSPTPDPCEENVLLKVVINDQIVLNQEDPCDRITPTPTILTPTETPHTNVDHSSSGSGGNLCGDTRPARVANINVVTTGNIGELEIQWALPIGADKVHIEYGLEKNAQHALLNTANDGNEVIRNLTSGEHYWFRVAGVNGCAVGEYSDWFDPIVP